jgi:hypothetical protein
VTQGRDAAIREAAEPELPVSFGWRGFETSYWQVAREPVRYLLSLLEAGALDAQIGWRGSWDRANEAARCPDGPTRVEASPRP